MTLSSRVKSVIAIGAVVLGLGSGIATAATVSAAVPCADNTTCMSGALAVQDPQSDEFPRNQLVVSDKDNAPMFWVNVGGAWSAANPFCVTDLSILKPVICVGGPVANGQGEPVVTFYTNGKVTATLTQRDVQWIHNHGG